MIILWARAYALEMQLLNCVNLHKIVKSLVAKYSIPFFGFMLTPLVHSLNWCWCVYLSLYQTFSVLNCGVWRVPDFTVIRKHHCDVLSVWCVYITALTSLFLFHRILVLILQSIWQIWLETRAFVFCVVDYSWRERRRRKKHPAAVGQQEQYHTNIQDRWSQT